MYKQFMNWCRSIKTEWVTSGEEYDALQARIEKYLTPEEYDAAYRCKTYEELEVYRKLIAEREAKELI